MNETVRPVHNKAKSRIRSGRRTPTRSTRRPTQLTARAYGSSPSPRCTAGHSSISLAPRPSVWQHRGAMDEWVVLLHVVAAFWFVAGLLGRNITMARARVATDIRTLDELVTLSGRFERLLVIPGSFAVVALGLLAAWALGQPL